VDLATSIVGQFRGCPMSPVEHLASCPSGSSSLQSEGQRLSPGALSVVIIVPVVVIVLVVLLIAMGTVAVIILACIRRKKE